MFDFRRTPEGTYTDAWDDAKVYAMERFDRCCYLLLLFLGFNERKSACVLSAVCIDNFIKHTFVALPSLASYTQSSQKLETSLLHNGTAHVTGKFCHKATKMGKIF